MKRFLVLVLFMLPVSAFAVQLGDNLEMAGFIKTEVWVRNRLDSNDQYLTSLKNTADIAMEYTFSDNWAFFFHPRYEYDFAYGIRDAADSFDRNQEAVPPWNSTIRPRIRARPPLISPGAPIASPRTV